MAQTETLTAQADRHEPAAAHDRLPGSAAVLALPLSAMARFRRLVQYEGGDVDLPRMCVDTAYAYACLADAHASSSAGLRGAAMALFAAYDRNAGALH